MSEFASIGALVVSAAATLIAVLSWRRGTVDRRDEDLAAVKISQLEHRVRELEETLANRNGTLDALAKRIGTLEAEVERQRMQLGDKDGVIATLREDLAGARARLAAAGIMR